MPRIPNHDELSVIFDDEDLRNPSVRAQMLDSYMGETPSAPIVRRPVGKLMIEDLGIFELVPL